MSITLNSKVYNWAQFDANGVGRYLETSGSYPSAFSNLTAKVTVSTGKSQKVKWKLAIPTVATEDSDCSCVGTVLSTDYVTVEFDLSSTGTLASRQDARLRLASLIADVKFIASVDTLVQPSS